MKFLPVFMLGTAILLSGCASDFSAPRAADAKPEESYVGLGSNIPRKGKRSDMAGVDLQQLENARTMGSANLEGGPIKN